MAGLSRAFHLKSLAIFSASICSCENPRSIRSAVGFILLCQFRCTLSGIVEGDGDVGVCCGNREITSTVQRDYGYEKEERERGSSIRKQR